MYEYKIVDMSSNSSPSIILQPKLNQGWEIMFSTTCVCYMRRKKKTKK